MIEMKHATTAKTRHAAKIICLFKVITSSYVIQYLARRSCISLPTYYSFDFTFDPEP